MNKFKKLLLTLAPLSAVAIATPIILTSCSTNATNPNDGSSNQKPGDGDNNTGLGNDGTNNDGYAPEENSAAGKILESYKKAVGEDAANAVLDSSLKEFVKIDGLTVDVMKMWSNNIWYLITKTGEDVKVKETFKSSLDLTNVPTISGDKASFDIKYSIGFNDSKNQSFEATRSFKDQEVSIEKDSTSIVIKSITEKYKINDKDISLEGKKIELNDAATSKTPQEKLEEQLKKTTLTLDAKAIFKTYITNHNIKFTEKEETLESPIWKDVEVKKDSTLSLNGNEVTLTLTATANEKWGKCKSDTAYTAIKSTFEIKHYQDQIKALIDSKDYDIASLTCGGEIKETGSSSMNVTIAFSKKAGKESVDSAPTLIFKVKGFKTTA